MSADESLRAGVLRVLCYAGQLQQVGELSEWLLCFGYHGHRPLGGGGCSFSQWLL